MSKRIKRYQCRHIFTDGHRCGSPCLRREEFCYYHHTTRRPAESTRGFAPIQPEFDIAVPEDRSAIQLSIGEVLRRIARNQIDPKRAGLLLYGLQIASLNLARAVEPARDKALIEIVDADTSLGTLAPRNEIGEKGNGSFIQQFMMEWGREKAAAAKRDIAHEAAVQQAMVEQEAARRLAAGEKPQPQTDPPAEPAVLPLIQACEEKRQCARQPNRCRTASRKQGRHPAKLSLITKAVARRGCRKGAVFTGFHREGRPACISPYMDFNHVRHGTGRPLLLIHGLGGHWRSWMPVLEPLAAARDVIAIDLPGFGETPPLPGEVSIATLSDAVTSFLRAHDLMGVDVVGSSMGARLVLELARRGVVGSVVSLAPGGFWNAWQRRFFGATIGASIRLVRWLQPVMPVICGSSLGRTLLFPQFSPRPWRLSAGVTLDEMRAYAAAPSFDPLLQSLAHGPDQQGAAMTLGDIVIGWGRNDRVCFPSQSRRAKALFPGARMHWFAKCGHFPHWDQPEQTVDLILRSTDRVKHWRDADVIRAG